MKQIVRYLLRMTTHSFLPFGFCLLPFAFIEDAEIVVDK
jgi:hypothetical protein